MAIREVIVTPELAKQLLDKNTHNRHMAESTVRRLVGAMNRGEWQYNGDTIRISKSGRLLDGQHRLAAIEKSGIPQKYIIVDGLDDESFTTIDVGKPRTSGDMLSIVGEKHSNNLAAVSRMDLVFLRTGKPMNEYDGRTPTHTEIVMHAEDNAEMKRSVSFTACNMWIRKYIGPSVSGFCHYRFCIDDSVMAERFFSELVSGDFSYSDSPIKYIRDFFLEERHASAKTPKMKRTAMMFRAYSVYKKSGKAKILRLPKDQNEWFKL
jgi:hypothetical protein